MARRYPESVLRDLTALWRGGSLVGSTDAELIALYNEGSSVAAESAFAALLARHGPLVLGTCRRFLGDSQESETMSLHRFRAPKRCYPCSSHRVGGFWGRLPTPRRLSRPSRSRFRPAVDRLEDRLVLSTFNVTNTQDSG